MTLLIKETDIRCIDESAGYSVCHMKFKFTTFAASGIFIFYSDALTKALSRGGGVLIAIASLLFTNTIWHNFSDAGTRALSSGGKQDK